MTESRSVVARAGVGVGSKREWLILGVGWLSAVMKRSAIDCAAAAAAAKSLQSCPTLWDPIDSSPPGSPVPGMLQARTLEWVAISFSNAWKWKVKSESEVTQSCLTLVTPWTAAYQAPLSMEFSRQEYWSGVPLPSPWLWWGLHNSKYTRNHWTVCLVWVNCVACELHLNKIFKNNRGK